jgi:hypothetical protein
VGTNDLEIGQSAQARPDDHLESLAMRSGKGRGRETSVGNEIDVVGRSGSHLERSDRLETVKEDRAVIRREARRGPGEEAPGQLRVSCFVSSDSREDAANLPIARAVELPASDDGRDGLADATLVEGFDRSVEQ